MAPDNVDARPPSTPPSPENSGAVVSFRQLLIDSALSDNLAIPLSIRGLDLREGNFSRDSERLLEASLKDREGHERGIDVYVTHDKRVLIRKRAFVGSDYEKGKQVFIPNDIEVRPFTQFLPRRYRQDRFRATVIHSHGAHDTPPSYSDLRNLFLTPEDSSALPIIFVITTDRKILVARTAQTPHFTRKELERKNLKWDRYTDQLFDSRVKSSMTLQEKRSLDSQIQMNVLRGIVKDNHLLLFVGDSTDDIIPRVDV